MHICPRCETTLSQTEVSEGYKDVKDIALTVKFKLKHPEKIGLSGDVYMLAWTTTPWTLPGNVALAVGNDIVYNALDWDGQTVIAAHDAILKKEICKSKSDWHVVKKGIKGSELVGLD